MQQVKDQLSTSQRAQHTARVEDKTSTLATMPFTLTS
nr:MAG TPA: hypothetical protein [Caudoviricetes sp.]